MWYNGPRLKARLPSGGRGPTEEVTMSDQRPQPIRVTADLTQLIRVMADLPQDERGALERILEAVIRQTPAN